MAQLDVNEDLLVWRDSHRALDRLVGDAINGDYIPTR
jgi:hypothetical protein